MRARGPWSWWLVVTAAGVLVAGILVAGFELSGGGRRWTDDRRIDVPVRGTEPRDVLWEPPVLVPVAGPESVPGPGPGEVPPDDVYAPFVASDGLERFLVRGRVRGHVRGSGERAAGDAEILSSRRGPDGWSVPEPIASIASPADEVHPALSPDGRWLYFGSDRPGGAGGFDLWRVPRTGEGWGTPEPLGQRVNTIHDELSPAWSPDGRRLWFASDRPRERSAAEAARGDWGGTMRSPRGGRRDFDLYAATAGDGGLAVAQRVAALSSDADDGTPAVSPAGDFLYFSSDRRGGAGGFDLYRVRLVAGMVGDAPASPLDGVNSPADELDPAMEHQGFGLLFASNRGGDGEAGGGSSPAAAGRERVWRSISREVRARQADAVARFDAGRILPAIPWLLALLLLALLAWLLRGLHVSGRLATIGLLTRCVLASAMVHLILALLLGAWTVSGALADGFSDRSGGTARLSSAAVGGGLERQLFGAAGEPLAAPIPDPRWTDVPAELVVSPPSVQAIRTPDAEPPSHAAAPAGGPRDAIRTVATPVTMQVAASRPAVRESLAVPAAPAMSPSAPTPTASAPRRTVEGRPDLAATSTASGRRAGQPSARPTFIGAADVPAAPSTLASEPAPPAAAPAVPRQAERTPRAAPMVEPSGMIAGSGGRADHRATEPPANIEAAAVAAIVPGPAATEPRSATPEASFSPPSPASPASLAIARADPVSPARPSPLGTTPIVPAPPTPDSTPPPGTVDSRSTPARVEAMLAGLAPPDRAELVDVLDVLDVSSSADVFLPPAPRPSAPLAGAADEPGRERAPGWEIAARTARTARAVPAPPVVDAAPPASPAAPRVTDVAPEFPLPAAVLARSAAAVPGPTDASDLAAVRARAPAADHGLPVPPAAPVAGLALPVPPALAAETPSPPDDEDESSRVEAAVAAAAREAGLTRVIIGRVLDEETGRPLPGAAVRLDVRDAESVVAPADEAGWYLLLAPDGPASVAITATRPGHLPASANVTADDRRGAVVRRDLRLAEDAGRRIALEDEPRVRHVGDDAFSGVVNSRFQRASDGPEVRLVFTLEEEWVAAARLRGSVVLTALVRGAQRDNPVRLNGRPLPRGFDQSPADGRFGEVQRRFPADLLLVGENVLLIRSAASGVGRDIDDFEFVNVQLEAVDADEPPPTPPRPARRRRIAI